MTIAHWVNICQFIRHGNVGIGTTSPTAKLDVAGTIAAINLPQRTSLYITTGTITCDSYEKTQTSMNFTGLAGQKVEIRTSHSGRLNGTGHHYNQLYLDGTLVDTAGVYGHVGWRSQVSTIYLGTLSSSGTHGLCWRLLRIRSHYHDGCDRI